MKRSVAVTALVNQARIRAAEELGALDATPENLGKLAAEVRRQIIIQAIAGLWSEWKVKTGEELEGLRVSARLGRKLLGEPPIVLEYDFRHTSLPTLIVLTQGAKQVRRRVGGVS